MSRDYKHWNTEKRLIPVMIGMYCRGNHKEARKQAGIKRNGLCPQCAELAGYAAFRLDKCPFKKDKGFCSYCRIHCYKPEYRTEMKQVMQYSGPRMLFSHPLFALSHVTAMLKHKRMLKRQAQQQSGGGATAVRAEQSNQSRE